MGLRIQCGEGIGTLPEVSLVQCIFSDARRIVLSARTTDLVTVCVEVSYGTVSSEGSRCTCVTTLDKIVKDEGTLLTKAYERKLDKLLWDLPVGGARVRKERRTYWLRQDKERERTCVGLTDASHPPAMSSLSDWSGILSIFFWLGAQLP
jgi:hypothetical protein